MFVNLYCECKQERCKIQLTYCVNRLLDFTVEGGMNILYIRYLFSGHIELILSIFSIIFALITWLKKVKPKNKKCCFLFCSFAAILVLALLVNAYMMKDYIKMPNVKTLKVDTAKQTLYELGFENVLIVEKDNITVSSESIIELQSETANSIVKKDIEIILVCTLNEDKLIDDANTIQLYAKPSADTDKWGYVDGNGTVVIPYIYDWADDFIDGYAAVRQHNYWGFIDTNGNEVISFKYDGAWSFINGLAPVFDDGLWGFIDGDGNVEIPFKFTTISRTYNGHEQVYLDENNKVINYSEEIKNAGLELETPTPTGVLDPPSGESVTPVPVREFLSSNVSANIVGSNLTITVNKDYWIFDKINSYSPFTWGISLASSFEEEVGDYIIDVQLCIDEGYSVNTVKMSVEEQLQNGVLVIDKMDNTCKAYYDGEQFVISCDIINDYISLEDLCIKNVYEYYE